MSYKDQLDSLSQYILKFEKTHESLKKTVSEETLQNLNVYQRNYIALTAEGLESDFPATAKYLGHDNFLYFVRRLLITKGINSPVIFEFSNDFLDFLQKSSDIHQDDLVYDIAQVDLMWSQGNMVEIQVSSGVLEFWQELMFDQETSKKINLDKLVTIKLIEIDGEQAFKVVNNTDVG